MKTHLQRDDKVGIISEIKRGSPSQGIINNQIDVEQLSKAYINAGATALSVLSDYKYFGGTLEDVQTARKFNSCPILRKEFIIDEYQLIEAKSVGADCILLIAAALSEKRCEELASFAKKLGLDVLLEVHNKEEIDSHLFEAVDIVGVNNRNLHDFTTNIDTSIALAQYIPDKFVKISESGITQGRAYCEVEKAWVPRLFNRNSFYESYTTNQACAKLISEVKRLERL